MGLAILLISGLTLLWLGGVLATVWMLTHPPRRTYASAVARAKPGDPSEADPPRRFESWDFPSRGRALPVWEVSGDDPTGPVVIVTHGWGDSRIGVLSRLPALAPVASRIIAWDSPGHGESPGLCSLGTGEVDDLCGLIERVGASRTVLYGWSLGAGVSLSATARLNRPPLLVIAETPYRVPHTPAEAVARQRGLPALWLVRPALLILRIAWPGLRAEPFDRLEIAKSVRSPILIVHGSEDDVCPIADGRQIAEAACAAVIEVAGAGHNNLWNNEEWTPRLVERLHEQIRTTLRGAAGPAV